MAQTSESTNTTAPRPRRRWGRVILFVCGGFLLLLVAAYFVGTSSAFLKSVVLPKVGDAMGSEVTAREIDLSPFSRVVIHDLKVVPRGAEPLMTAKEVQVRYSLSRILGGNMEVTSINITDPVVTIVEKPDGKSNLDPVLEAQEDTAKDSEAKKEDEPTKFKLGSMNLTNGEVTYTKNHEAGKTSVTRITQFFLGLQNVGNNQSGKAVSHALIDVQDNPPAPATNGTLRAKLDAQYEFALGADLMPSSVKGSSQFNVEAAGGSYEAANGIAADLLADVTPSELRQVLLTLRQRGQTLGQMRAYGPLNLEKREGKVTAELTGVDRRVFNLATSDSGMDFGTTALSATNVIALSQTGQVVSVVGQAGLTRLQVIRTNQTSPTMDFRANYDLTVDLTRSNAQVRVFNVVGSQQNSEFMRGQLGSPLAYSWAATNAPIPDSTWNLVISRMNLADWKAFMGEVAPAGIVSGEMRLSSQDSGKSLVLNIGSQIQDFSVVSGTNAADQIKVSASSFRGTNLVRLTDAMQIVTTVGQMEMAGLQITRTNQTTPNMDLRANYDTTVDLTNSQALLRAFNLSGIQAGKEILTGRLTSPMTVAWGSASNAVPDSTWNLTLSGLNLADWKAFSGGMVPTGVVAGEAKLTSQQAGKVLVFDVASELKDLSVVAGSNTISQLAVIASANGTATNLEHFNLPQLKFDMGRAGQPILNVSGAGLYNKLADAAVFQLSGSAEVASLAALAPQPDLHLRGGSAQMSARITQNFASATNSNASGAPALDQRLFLASSTNSLTTRSIGGQFSVTNLTGQVGSNSFDRFSARADMDISMDDRLVDIRRMTGQLFGSGRAGGSFDVSGTYAPSNNATRMKLALTGMNQDGLRPFLEPTLSGKQLVSVTVNGKANVLYEPLANSAISSDFSVTNLVVHEGGKPVTPEPLALGMALDTMLAKGILDIRTARMALTPTPRATNVVTVSGRLDMSDTNFTKGNLKISAPALDVTRYYDVFTSTNTATTTAAATPAPASSARRTTAATAPEPEKEAEPMPLPFTNFVVEATAGKVFLHEVEITNLQSTVSINAGKVQVKPMQLSLNGAPVSGAIDLDLGVPGFKYDIGFNARQVPIAPMVNSFQPERRGQVAGVFTGQMQFAGAGTTSSNLNRNLQGNFDFTTTNLNLAIPTLRSPLMKTVIDVIGVVPEILRNPTSALGALSGALLGGSRTQAGGTNSTGLMDELMQSPLDVVQGRGVIGGGRVDIQDSLIQSPAFQAQARGSVVLQPVVTNSILNVPLSVSLKRSVAARINMLPAGTPTNVAYVKLPDYVTIKGTVGAPKSDINKLALLGTAAMQAGSGSIPGVDEKTGGILRSIGGVLTGSAGNTNAAGTNQPRQGNVTQGIGTVLGGGGNTNASSTNRQSRTERTIQGIGSILNSALGTNQPSGGTNSGTNANPVGSLLDQLLGPKK